MDREERRFSPQRISVVNRGQAQALARSQPQRAFELARTIPDGWYRCQAMAHIAAQADDPLCEQAFAEARAAAAASFDEYQRTGALSYAITAALARGRRALADTMLRDALAIAPAVEPMASRAFALNLIWSTVAHHGDARMRERVLAAVQAHVHPDRSWRAKRLYGEIVAWLAARDKRSAMAAIGAMPPGKARAYLARRLAPNPRGSPDRS